MPAAAQPPPDPRPSALQSLIPEGENLAATLDAAAELLADASPREAMYALAWHPDGIELATGGVDGIVTLWDLETGLERRRLEDSSRAVQSLTYSPDGRWLASGSDAGIVRLWDLTKDREPRRLDGWAVAFNPSDNQLAIGARDGKIQILDPQSRDEELASWPGHGERISALSWHPAGTALASGSWDRTAKLWYGPDSNGTAHTGGTWDRDSTDGRRLDTDHEERVNAVSWSPDGGLLATASADSTVRVWDPATGEELRRFDGHRTAATAVAWHPGGHSLASASRDGTVRLLSHATGEEVAQLENYGGEVFAVSFNPSGSLLAAATEDGFIGLWGFSSGRQVRQIGGQVSPVEALAFDHPGQILAAGSKGEIRLWGAPEVNPRGPLVLSLAGGQTPRCLALDNTGETLAAGFQEGPIAWWRRSAEDASRFERQAPLPTHSYALAALEFSPSGAVLATGFDDGTIHVRDLSTREIYRDLEYPRSEQEPPSKKNLALAFSPDGNRLVGAFADRTLYLWDLESRELLSTATSGAGGDVLDIRFTSPTRVIAVLRGGDVHSWDSGQRTTRLVGRLDRNLSAAAFGGAGEALATAGQRQGLVRIEKQRSQGVFELFRALLGSGQGRWIDCRRPGRCYRYDDGTVLMRQGSSGELEPLPVQRPATAPDLQFGEPPPTRIQIADGESAPVTLKLRNPGPQRALWVRVHQTGAVPDDPVVFQPPAGRVIIEPGEDIELRGEVSMQSAYENPVTEEAELNLVVTSAGGKHLFLGPIRVTNIVPTVEWRGARISLGAGRLSVDLANTEDVPFSASHVSFHPPDAVGPLIETDAFADLGEGQEARFEQELSSESRSELSRRLDFAVYKTEPPVHRWSFENQRLLAFPFDRPWLYLALLLALLPVAAYLLPRFVAWRRPPAAGRRSGLHSWVGDPQAEYAQLAIVFTDVVKSTQLLHDIKTAAWSKVRNQHFNRTDALVVQHGGYVVKSTGDGRLVAFRNSIDALKFALELESQTGHPRIRIRVGIHVGQVQLDQDDIHGPVVHLASRVMDIAKNGGVVASNQVKADHDSAFHDHHHPYSWEEIQDREIPDFKRHGNPWLVRYKAKDGSLEKENV
ncbi:MAG: hypothetical protein GY719_28640 [bacterium]|nr:hypothetical protein [bacterium]